MRSRRLPLGSSGGSRRDRAASEGGSGTSTAEKQVKKAQSPAGTPKTELRSSKASLNGSSSKPPPSSGKRGKSDTSTAAALVVQSNGGDSSEHKMPEKQPEKVETRSSKENQVERRSQRENSKKRKPTDSPLVAVLFDGSTYGVSLVMNGTRLTLKDAEAFQDSKEGYLGNDGNQYFCQVCQGFGDVVCCDGCPRVYHRTCLPHGPSRNSLENDEDPWYCPECFTAKKKSRRSEKEDRLSSQQRCVDCQQGIDGLSVTPCTECGNYTHHPSCRIDASDSKRPLCGTCFAVDALSQEDEENFEESLVDHDGDGVAEDDASQMDCSRNGTPDSDGEGQDGKQSRKKKRKSSIDDTPRKKSKETGSAKKKKKKKKLSSPPDDELGSLVSDNPEEPTPAPIKQPAIAQATPAFYFYLAENRWKIERVLSKRSRPFNRLSRGRERNVLVAKEAAIWWSKLRPSDHKRYVNMSMRDFESRVIEWKEDKHIREMSAPDILNDVETQAATVDYSEDDKKLTVRKHKRLFISTSVGSKIFKPENDQNYNRVLLDLLHDNRFHPLPMFGSQPDDTTDEEKEDKEGPASKVLIPYFEVHGPVSTSVGDECLGCLRGWAHYCNVIQRRIPAVEPRAKLQPPLSSLLATRIGLGLRQSVWKKELPPSSEKKIATALFDVMDSDEKRKLDELQVLPSATLDDTNERIDDVVEFIEQAIAMRVPEPPRPEDDASFTKALNALPGGPREATSPESARELHKCGRCRAILRGDTGCFQCRRAQLVINLAKRNKQDAGKILRVQTTMLGRVNLQDRSDTQSEQDQAVARGLLKERWMPCTVLEPQRLYAPDPSNRKNVSLLESSDASTSHDSEEEGAASGVESVRRLAARKESEAERDRPLRSARSASSFSESYEPGDHQAVLESNRKQVNAFQKRVVTIACCGMLHALRRRDPLNLFEFPVTVEGYRDIIKHPMDFGRIRKKVLEDAYSSVVSFCSDVKQLVENANMYNAPNSIYAKTANELLELTGTMQKSAVKWISTLRDAYARHLAGDEVRRRKMMARLEEMSDSSQEDGDAFEELRAEWPEAVEMLDNEEWIKAQAATDFMRTKENEIAYYGSLAISRAAAAAEASLASYTDSKGIFNVVGLRTAAEDAALRETIDNEVSQIVGPPRLKDPSSWREESVHRLLRRLQSRRLDIKTASEQQCSRCDGLSPGTDFQLTMKAEQAAGKSRRSEEHKELIRVDPSRMSITTGLASKKNREVIEKRSKQSQEEQFNSVNDSFVSVRGSGIHGWGLFADQEFKKDDVVAEYVGEYIDNDMAEEREKKYREQRIQDYMFRVNDDLVIDATMKGGKGRYANHSCGPNCFAKNISVDGSETKRRVMIIALRSIEVNEEITYDYQFPLELDLENRLPCNCRSEACRGFMNWDLPERGSVTPLLVQKRGANMRDRIRRLGRPLKRDENQE